MNNPLIDMSASKLPERPSQRTAMVPTTPMEMIQIAVSQGADLAKIEKLMDLQDRWEAGLARKAYVAAMALFKAEPARILKTKTVNIPGGAKFAHATLADVCDGVVANLSKFGLSHSWSMDQSGNQIKVTCTIRHEAGHSESVSLAAPPDNSGKKNPIQEISSTISYLERITLLAITGLSARDMDNDGRGGGNAEPLITEEQAIALKAMLEEIGPKAYTNFLRAAKITALDQILAKNYDASLRIIKQHSKEQGQ